MILLDQFCQIFFYDVFVVVCVWILLCIVDIEFFVVLIYEFVGDQVELQIFVLFDGFVVLVCDVEEWLVGFLGGLVVYLVLFGCILVGVLVVEGCGLLINFGYLFEMLLDSVLLVWLVQMFQVQFSFVLDEVLCVIILFDVDVVQCLVVFLGQCLGDMCDLVCVVGLMVCEWVDGCKNYFLVLCDVLQDCWDVVVKVFVELLVFLFEVLGGIDIVFLDQDLFVQVLLIIVLFVVFELFVLQCDLNVLSCLC